MTPEPQILGATSGQPVPIQSEPRPQDSIPYRQLYARIQITGPEIVESRQQGAFARAALAERLASLENWKRFVSGLSWDGKDLNTLDPDMQLPEGF